jgi:hypothetical protein
MHTFIPNYKYVIDIFILDLLNIEIIFLTFKNDL